MATFIDLVKSTRLICGMQGIGPSTVKGNQGVEEVLVRFVRDAYVDIQNLREDWQWLEAKRSFTTTAGKDTYTIQDIFGTTESPLKKYKLDSFLITDEVGFKRYMSHSDRDYLESRYLNSTAQELPVEFAIDPANYSVLLKPVPNGSYPVTFRYQRTPEILTENAQVPLLPISFHNLITYKATEKMAIYLSAPEIFSGYATETNRMLGQLMRMEIPKMRMNIGNRRFS